MNTIQRSCRLIPAVVLAVQVIGSSVARAQYTREPNQYTDPQTGEILEYNIVRPNGYDANADTKYPLLVCLHAASDTNPPNRTLGSDGNCWVGTFNATANQARYPSFYMMPISQTNMSGWGDAGPNSPITQPEKFEGRLTVVVVRELLTRFKIDPDRLYITGPSMGARGTWDIIRRNPTLFAAAAPAAGPAAAADATLYASQNIWSINGENDTTAPDNRTAIDAIRAAGGNPIYTELANHGHDSWRTVYPMPEFMAWMFAQRRGVPWWNHPPAAPTMVPGASLSQPVVVPPAGTGGMSGFPGGAGATGTSGSGGAGGGSGGQSSGSGGQPGGAAGQPAAGQPGAAGQAGGGGGAPLGTSGIGGDSGVAGSAAGGVAGSGPAVAGATAGGAPGSAGVAGTEDSATALDQEGGCSYAGRGGTSTSGGALLLLTLLALGRARRRRSSGVVVALSAVVALGCSEAAPADPMAESGGVGGAGAGAGVAGSAGSSTPGGAGLSAGGSAGSLSVTGGTAGAGGFGQAGMLGGSAGSFGIGGGMNGGDAGAPASAGSGGSGVAGSAGSGAVGGSGGGAVVGIPPGYPAPTAGNVAKCTTVPMTGGFCPGGGAGPVCMRCLFGGTTFGTSETTPTAEGTMLAGNYLVTVTLGGPAAGQTFVSAESSRGLLRPTSTAAGEARDEAFVVNVRAMEGQPRHDGGPSGYPGLNLFFSGPTATPPKVTAIGYGLATPATKPVMVYMAGDSTVCDQTGNGFGGWGQMLPQYFAAPVGIANYANSGASSNFGFWNDIKAKWSAGDWVIIQFGHNDKMATDAQVQANLERMVTDALAANVTPILVSPPARVQFSNGMISNQSGLHGAAARAAAAAKNVAFIDLTALSTAWYNTLGSAAEALKFHAGGSDVTHTNLAGADKLAALVAADIRAQNLGLARYLRQ